MQYILGGVALLLATIFIVARVLKGGYLALGLKAVASLGFVSVALVGTITNGFNLIYLFIVLGLVFGLVGDVLLDLKVIDKSKEDLYLNLGFGSFILGHVMYFVSAVLFSNRYFYNDTKTLYLICIAIGFGLIVSLLMAMFGEKLLKIKFGKFKVQCFLYTFVLAFMTAFSVAMSVYTSKYWIFAAGLILFFASDLILSLQYFGDKQDNKFLTIANHFTYYVAQILIAVTVFFI